MSQTKEAELMVSFFLFVARCREIGDERAVLDAGIGPKELNAISSFDVADFARMGELQANCLAIRLDQEAFWLMVERLKSRKIVEETQRKLLIADAPAEMLRSLLGTDPKTYSRLCRELGVQPSTGRPLDCDADSERRLWEAWSENGKKTDMAADEFLALSEETNVPLRAVWRQYVRWQEEFLS